MKTEVLTTLKQHMGKVLNDLHQSKEPVLLTKHGHPTAYLLNVDEYEFMCQRMAILEDIVRDNITMKELLINGLSINEQSINKR